MAKKKKKGKFCQEADINFRNLRAVKRAKTTRRNKTYKETLRFIKTKKGLDARVRSVTFHVDKSNIVIDTDQYSLFLALMDMGYAGQVHAIKHMDLDLSARVVPNKAKKAEPHMGKQRSAVYKEGHGVCYLCGKKIPVEEATIDHVIPKCRGGKNGGGNMKCCCRRCNQMKAGFRLDDFLSMVRDVYAFQFA